MSNHASLTSSGVSDFMVFVQRTLGNLLFGMVSDSPLLTLRTLSSVPQDVNLTSLITVTVMCFLWRRSM